MNPVTYTDFDHVFWVLNRSGGFPRVIAFNENFL